MKFDKDKIISEILNYDVVSFDIFDTLIKRTVEKPSDVFEIVQLRYNTQNKNFITGFKDIRIKAEKLAREKSMKEDIEFSDIYTELLEMNIYTSEVIENLARLELEVEKNVCIKNVKFEEIYNSCLNNKKKIIITSDMYLGKQFLTSLLNEVGYNSYDKLYVSSDTGVLKSTGEMFKYILNDLNITAKDIIHIGDAKKGDFLVPQLQGIKSINIPRYIKNLNYFNRKELRYNDLQEYKILSAFINSNIVKYKGDAFKIGYEVLGPILYGFSKWLANELKSRQYEKVMFLAREGKLLKLAFETLYPNYEELEYVYVSRRSLTVPRLKNVQTFEDVMDTISIKRDATLEDFFIACGLKYEEHKELVKKYNYTKDSFILKIHKENKFKQFFTSFLDLINENGQKEYEILIEYLNQVGFENNVAIIDIGWKGSMQNALMSIFNEQEMKVNIDGYYLGLKSSSIQYVNNGMKAKGYLFNNGENMDNELKIMSFVGLCEILFQADHGSTICYEKISDKIEAKLCDYEFSDKDKRFIKEIQEGGIAFIKDFKTCFHSELIDFNPTVLMNSLFILGGTPTKNDLKKFGALTFLDGKVESLIGEYNSIKYFLSPNLMKSHFLNSSWKVGYLKRLFSLNLNYFSLYKRIKRFDR